VTGNPWVTRPAWEGNRIQSDGNVSHALWTERDREGDRKYHRQLKWLPGAKI